MTDGKTDNMGNITQSQLLHHIRSMRLDRFNADAETVSDGLTGLPLSYQCEDLQFTRRQDAKIRRRWHFLGACCLRLLLIDLNEHHCQICRIDLSHHTLLHFAQTSHEKAQDWQEAILIDDGASPQQVDALLQLFEKQQGSEVAHLDHIPPFQRAMLLMCISGMAMAATLSPNA
jgi:hypothetical protein